jgi:hypothetical protein
MKLARSWTRRLACAIRTVGMAARHAWVCLACRGWPLLIDGVLQGLRPQGLRHSDERGLAHLKGPLTRARQNASWPKCSHSCQRHAADC